MPGNCPRCSKQVYFAEEKKALGKSWHKMCFKCANCSKLLDSTNVTQRQEEIYCKTCYGRLFGPKGYGFGGGSGVLNMDSDSQSDTALSSGQHVSHTSGTGQHTNNNNNNNNNNSARSATYMSTSASGSAATKMKFGGSDTCRRCGKAVYAAEKVMGGGGVYHRLCFTCASCHKSLQITSLTEHDNEVHCRACYGRNFGPKGYGYGIGAGCLQSENGS